MDGPIRNGRQSSERILLPKYRMVKTLGIGSFGKVKLARHILTGHKVAIKILNRQMIRDSEAEKVKREINILKLFVHPHIVRLYEVIETHLNIYVVMEYINCGELLYYIMEKGRLQEDEARYFFQQIISGVEFCHLHRVVHRDLKPENLLLDSNRNVKLADFGLSNVMRDGHFLKTCCGSPNYAAPEVISGQLYAGPEIDVWSCGVILYALLCGRLPFDVDNLANLFKKIKSGTYSLPGHLSHGARDLILRVLVVDPMKRITIPEIRRHSWFKDHIPRYLTLPAVDAMQGSRKIDEEILQDVIKIGFDRNQVIESLQKNVQNQATVTYYLLLDNRFCAFSGYLREEFQEALEGGFSSLHISSGTSSIVNCSLQKQGYAENGGSCPRLQRTWAVGIQSQAPPCEIMRETLRALQSLNVHWKRIGPYAMKCRWSPSYPSQCGNACHTPLHRNDITVDKPTVIEIEGFGIAAWNVVKFEMQLYKATEEKYLLDLQLVLGSPIHFLEICFAFLTRF